MNRHSELASAALDLRGMSDRKLEELERESVERGVSISAKPHSGCLYIGDALKDVVIAPRVAQLLSEHTQPKATAGRNSPCTVKELIMDSGGLYRAIRRVEALLRLERLWSEAVDETDYVNDLLSVLLQSESLISRKYQRKHNSQSQYCVLCWRLPDRSHYYCDKHHPESESNAYHSAKRTLIRAICDRGGDIGEEYALFKNGGISSSQFPFHLSGWLDSFAPKTTFFISFSSAVDFSDWKAVAATIGAFVTEFYPAAAAKLGRIDLAEYETWESWALGLVERLDKLEADSWRAADWLNWDRTNFLGASDSKARMLNALVLLHLFRRFEATATVNSHKPKRGPKPGSGKNDEQLLEVLRLSKIFEARGKVRCGADIGRELGISRARANKLLKQVRAGD